MPDKDNFSLLEEFFNLIQKQGLSDKDQEIVEEKAADLITSTIWLVMLANSSPEQLEKLKSPKEEEVKATIEQIVTDNKNNPRVIQETSNLVEKLLADWVEAIKTEML